MEACRKRWQGKNIILTGYSTRKMEILHLYESSGEVARVLKYIVWPLSCAQAILWAALVMHRCEKLYKQQSLVGSQLGLAQQTFSGK